MNDYFALKHYKFSTGREEWIVTGPEASIQFWIEKELTRDGTREFYGGIETHYKTCPRYMKGDLPNESCRVNDGGKCWHDGSVLWAEQYWIPEILPLGTAAIFKRLIEDYEEEFETKVLIDAA